MEELVEVPMVSEEVSEEDEDLKDALSPIYDQLKLKRGWRILEILPVTFKHPHSDDEWVEHWR